MQVVAHNLIAQFTNRQLNITTNNKGKSAERLSSGYRINRSADDAAGLSISEKMRWQIRGLDKGARNIMDGISLLDTADGALNETHSILQRIRELSIQAYNDTNTRDDRDALQSEVDNCLAEIEHIAETTTFNTKQLLRGNPTELIEVTGNELITVTTSELITKDIPDWLNRKTDKKMEVHSGYTQQQDTTGIMLKYDGTNNSPKEYYGPQNAPGVPAGYTHKDVWTPDIKDNPSAKIDFSELNSITKSSELYKSMYDLIGCKLAYPCGTCSTQVNSISFGGNEETLSTEGFMASSTVDINGELNLSETSFSYNGNTYTGYFNAIQDLINTYSKNYDDDLTNDDLAGEENAVKNLAKSIAKDLRNKTADILGSKMTDHFDRVVNGDDDYSLIVYDYRDNSALTSLNAADSPVITSSRVNCKTAVSMLTPGQTVLAQSPLKIMCGAQNTSMIDIDLSDMSVDALGLTGYSVSRYDTIEVYSADYQQKIQAWEANPPQTQTTHSKTVKVYDSAKSEPQITGEKYVNGEKKTFVISSGKIVYKDETRTYTVTTYGPKPTPNPGDIKTELAYSPDSVLRIDEAIKKVSMARAYFGATKNRLEHAYNLNTNSEENTQAAESKLRDADMAEEMVTYSKHNILEQVGQSLLTQANQSPQNLLKLLQ